MLQLQTLIKCLDKLDNHLVEILKRHHQMFSFRTEEGIDYLSLHVEYVVCGYCVWSIFLLQCLYKRTCILTVHVMQNM